MSGDRIAANSLFQSTHLREVRRVDGLVGDDGIIVSIHAPARGATYHLDVLQVRAVQFQSTHLREVRHDYLGDKPSSGNVSIHAPARGATHNRPRLDPAFQPFQSTHLREVRLGLYNPARVQRKNFLFREHGANA